jgi:hypothetical protein
MNWKCKYNIKLRLIAEQKQRCCYCNCKFNYKDKRTAPTLEHVDRKCYVWDKTKFKVSCKKCNLYKGCLSEDLFLDWYICVNFKYSYNWVSENKAVKVRQPLRWYNKLFPTRFNWNKKRYNITQRFYDL